MWSGLKNVLQQRKEILKNKNEEVERHEVPGRAVEGHKGDKRDVRVRWAPKLSALENA